MNNREIVVNRLVLDGCEEWIMYSKHRELEYRIMVSYPSGDMPEGGYPVIYALDGDAMFYTLAEAGRVQTRKPHGYDPVVIVGIAYPSKEPFDMKRRCYDFTIPVHVDSLPERPDRTLWPEHGGADYFLDFLEQQLQPAMANKFTINKSRQALFGHSLGGLFTLHALFTRPRSFSHFIAGSPSIWWGDYAITHEQAIFIQQHITTTQARLLVTVGAEELTHMVLDAEALVTDLQAREGSHCEVQLVKFIEESHVSVLPAAISRLIRFVLEK